ncbi:MAG: bifunctional phosphoribosylaminoimidazolecarboxamide formyltransferase/IMP cyclohydrolase [Dactylosporangium sp.]|nr:bifunctional phosphoribosylaminoimidazolecarboxamide formyltransferase/IMP cyclohydrolase [Dactylosporangium sp.]
MHQPDADETKPTAARPIRRALVSVYDKTGLTELVTAMNAAGVEIVSTGSTAARIAEAGVPVTRVDELTGFPECLDGRVKTLHPRIHAGLLADLRLAEHQEQLADLGIAPFDLLVANLYPFAETVASGSDIDACIEQIDIGGPTMVRAAAKNHASMAVVTSPAAYPMIINALTTGGTTLDDRRRLAVRAFADIAEYDVAIAAWCAEALAEGGDAVAFPAFAGMALRRAEALRYGENPHQAAALYTDPAAAAGLAQARQLHGKDMSYNNYVDGDAAWRAANDFSGPCVAVIKHANPCGIAVGGDIAQAHRKAHACDPLSAFGGIIASNREVSVAMAEQVAKIFTEAVIAPGYADGAVSILAARKNLRILVAPAWHPAPVEYRPVSGGALAQTTDRVAAAGDDPATWTLAAGTAADPATLADLAFAWRAVRAVKSNAILLAADTATVGVGMGQVNRVDAARLAVARAGDRAQGSVAASDAFFPFPDGLQVLIDGGVRAVVQPGGSMRDDQSIEAAATAGITMYLTGTRHFFH